MKISISFFFALAMAWQSACCQEFGGMSDLQVVQQACNLPAQPVWESWRPQVENAVKAGNSSQAEIVTCQAVKTTVATCQGGLDAYFHKTTSPESVAMVHAQVRAQMIAHGLKPPPCY